VNARAPASRDGDVVLAHFRQRTGQGHGQHLRKVAHHVMGMVLDQLDFDSLDSLIAFCNDADNLKVWFPNEVDRAVFSHEFVQGLRELACVSSGECQAPRMKDEQE